MKFPCRVCGCHFPQDFDETKQMPCGFWGDLGLANVPDEDKVKIWNWIFSLPADEMGLKYGIGIGIQISTVPIQKEDMFENQIPGYNDLSEEERQRVQKDYFKKQKWQRPPNKKEKKIES